MLDLVITVVLQLVAVALTVGVFVLLVVAMAVGVHQFLKPMDEKIKATKKPRAKRKVTKK